MKKLPKNPFGLFLKSFPKLLKSDIKFSHFDSCNLCVAVGVPWNINYHLWVNLQGVPKKMVIRKGFEFLTLGGVFLGVKNNSKNFGNKKNIRLFSKILSKWTLFIRKMQKFWCFYELLTMSRMENFFKMS